MLKDTTATQSLHKRVLYWLNRAMYTLSAFFLGEFALYGIFRCPFIIPFVSCQNCPVMTCPGRVASFFWGLWGGILALSIFFGRAFCGWVCPGGFLAKIFALNPLKMKKALKFEKKVTYVKYMVLLAALYVYFILGQPRENIPMRMGDFGESMYLTYINAFPLWQWRTLFIVIALLLGVFISAAWCRFLCPTGGILELFKKFSPFAVYKTDDCNDCCKCLRDCYMRTRPSEINCTNCGDCLDSCPKGCIHIGRKK